MKIEIHREKQDTEKVKSLKLVESINGVSVVDEEGFYLVKMNKQKQGKKNRAVGRRFELKVRKDLESKGWIVSKWQNNVEFTIDLKEVSELLPYGGEVPAGKLVPAKMGRVKSNKIRKSPLVASDSVLQKVRGVQLNHSFHQLMLNVQDAYVTIGVEVKSNGYLDKEEKAKCEWLLNNNIFSKILIAKKGKKRGEIIYTEYKGGLNGNRKKSKRI